jgi:hypothetical protein
MKTLLIIAIILLLIDVLLASLIYWDIRKKANRIVAPDPETENDVSN